MDLMEIAGQEIRKGAEENGRKNLKISSANISLLLLILISEKVRSTEMSFKLRLKLPQR